MDFSYIDPEMSTENVARLVKEITSPASLSDLPAFKHKCFQSLLNFKIQKDGKYVVVCVKCWMKWSYVIKECPLCHRKDPRGERSKKGSRVPDKILKETSSSAEMLKKCYSCNIVDVKRSDYADCDHRQCEECCEKYCNTMHGCLFCGELIPLVRLVESEEGGIRVTRVEHRCGPFLEHCRECFREWAPGDRKCAYCRLENNPCDNHARPNDPSRGPVNVATIQASTSNFVAFLGMRDMLIKIQQIMLIVQLFLISVIFGRPNPAYETAIEAPVSNNNNNGLNASENVQNLTINERSAMSGDIKIGQEDSATLATEDEGAEDALVE